jgi:hypothetical protein
MLLILRAANTAHSTRIRKERVNIILLESALSSTGAGASSLKEEDILLSTVQLQILSSGCLCEALRWIRTVRNCIDIIVRDRLKPYILPVNMG